MLISVGVAELVLPRLSSIRVSFDRVGQDVDFRVNVVLLRVDLFCCERGSRSLDFGVRTTCPSSALVPILAKREHQCSFEQIAKRKSLTATRQAGADQVGRARNAKAITTDSQSATESPWQ